MEEVSRGWETSVGGGRCQWAGGRRQYGVGDIHRGMGEIRTGMSTDRCRVFRQIMSEYNDCVQRAGRLAACREAALDEADATGFITTDDLFIYLRWLVCHLHSTKHFTQYMRVSATVDRITVGLATKNGNPCFGERITIC